MARFGSAELVARVCLSEAKRGASVPTTKTRSAGIALVLAPLFVAVGQVGNVAVEKGGLHGFAVMLIVAAFPLLVVGLWVLRARHGGLGRLGLTALILAAVSPVLSLAALYGAIVLLAFLLGVALVMFAVEMLRASVLPVVPLVLMAAGPIVFVVVAVGVAITNVYHGLAVLLPLSLTAIGLAWLGRYLWREPAVDAPRRRRSIVGA